VGSSKWGNGGYQYLVELGGFIRTRILGTIRKPSVRIGPPKTGSLMDAER